MQEGAGDAMKSYHEFDWKAATVEEQMRWVRAAPVHELSAVMRYYDWSLYPETVLGWVSAQKGIELSAALAAFFNGDPWRFNYVPKRDVSEEYHGIVRLLDTICRRINAGFYLPDSHGCIGGLPRLGSWMENQRVDVRSRLCGRWVIHPEVLDPMLTRDRKAMEEELRREIGDDAEGQSKGFRLREIIAPLAG